MIRSRKLSVAAFSRTSASPGPATGIGTLWIAIPSIPSPPLATAVSIFVIARSPCCQLGPIGPHCKHRRPHIGGAKSLGKLAHFRAFWGAEAHIAGAS